MLLSPPCFQIQAEHQTHLWVRRWQLNGPFYIIFSFTLYLICGVDIISYYCMNLLHLSCCHTGCSCTCPFKSHQRHQLRPRENARTVGLIMKTSFTLHIGTWFLLCCLSSKKNHGTHAKVLWWSVQVKTHLFEKLNIADRSVGISFPNTFHICHSGVWLLKRRLRAKF